jgi:hypothetical protein
LLQFNRAKPAAGHKGRDRHGQSTGITIAAAEFVKDGESAFNLSQLLGCGADGYDDWPDWKPFASRGGTVTDRAPASPLPLPPLAS